MIIQGRSKKQETGRPYQKFRRKKLYLKGRTSTLTKLAPVKQKLLRTKGGNSKRILLDADQVNLYDPNKKKSTKVQIKTVLENPANKNYVRRNIINKGTIVDTDMGKARITSRPGQEGTLNAVLI